MHTRIYVMVCCFVLFGLQPVEAQTTQTTLQNQPGVLLEPLHTATLCVILTNQGPQWFVFHDTMENEYLGSFSAAFHLLAEMNASPNGKYLAVVSVGEGHPMLEVIDVPALLQQHTYSVLHSINPYPGTLSVISWNGDALQIESNVLLTQLDPVSGEMPRDIVLSTDETFELDASTGKITAISPGAKNPIEYYITVLMDPLASDADKDQALSMVLSLSSGETALTYLLKVLEQEQDPKRVNMLLDEINKLRTQSQ